MKGLSYRLFLLLSLLAASSLLLSCTGSDSVTDEQLTGLYKSSNETVDFFFISVDKSVYTLSEDQGDYKRYYRGDIPPIVYQYKKESNYFQSGEVKGNKVLREDTDIPESLRTLIAINEAALPLRRALNEEGLKLEVRLERDHPSFVESQATTLALLGENKGALVQYLKTNGLEALWVNDYTNDNVYSQSKRLNLPAGITKEPAEILDQIVNQPGTIDEL